MELKEQISRHNYYSFLWHAVFLALAVNFMDMETIKKGYLLEVTTNENRALYTGLSGAGGILPVIFPFLGGWIITEFGFTPFFILFILVIFLSFYFILKMDCQK